MMHSVVRIMAAIENYYPLPTDPKEENGGGWEDGEKRVKMLSSHTPHTPHSKSVANG
jgi:hypothetical protein